MFSGGADFSLKCMKHIPVSSVLILIKWTNTGSILEFFHNSVIHSILKGVDFSFSIEDIIDFSFNKVRWIMSWIPVSSIALCVL